MTNVIHRVTGFFQTFIDRYRNLGYKAKKKIRFVIGRIFLYYVLIELAYLFLLPFIYILTTSMMSYQDYLDPTVEWIPTAIEWENFTSAWQGLNYPRAFLNSLITSLGSAILQSVSCAIIGYALGRFKFKGKNILFVLVILVLLIPPQTTILSSYGLWATFGMTNTYWPILIPCIFGLGLRGALFALIYMYFFQRVPDAMDDAARIDGAGPFRVFLQIMLPLVKSSISIVFIFSFVWHWNDNYEAPTYMFNQDMLTLQPKLENIQQYYSELMGYSGEASEIDKAMTEPMLFAGCLMVMIPVLIVYIAGQNKLASGIERIGVIE
mgnify:FL=1